jgi:5-methylcytosine-specific restriction endonuclease McrA
MLRIGGECSKAGELDSKSGWESSILSASAIGHGEKRCSKCKEIKTQADFHKGKQRAWCKDCSNSYAKEHREKNKEAIKKRAKESYYKDHDKSLKKAKDWADKNRGKINSKRRGEKEQGRIYARKYRMEHAEQYKKSHNEYQRKWVKNNPEKVADISRVVRARKKDAFVEKVESESVYKRDNWICGICKKKVNGNLHYPNPMSKSIDHIIPLSQGGKHERKNVQLAHLVCNISMKEKGIKQTLLFG